VPTDVRGLTLSRTPQQVLRIVTLGSPTGRGGFFPRGVNGRIVSPAGFSDAVNARGGWPGNLVGEAVTEAGQEDRASRGLPACGSGHTQLPPS
jgi:hypothetical protein